MEGGAGYDTIVGGNGTDKLHGGDGNDTMQGFEGADVVRGDGGDDSVSGGKEEPETNAADVVDGGPGVDSIPDVDADYNRGYDDDVSVTLDGVANDGEAGENDNVIGVEKLLVSADTATIVGSDAAEEFTVDASSSSAKGMGGNDRLIAWDGADTLEGGDGDDFLVGGFGNDVLDGGAGVDQFNGDRTEPTSSRSATTRSARATATASRSTAASVPTRRRWIPATWWTPPARRSTGKVAATRCSARRRRLATLPRRPSGISPLGGREPSELRMKTASRSPAAVSGQIYEAGGDRAAEAREAEGQVLQGRRLLLEDGPS